MERVINEEELDKEENQYAEEHAMRAVMVEVYKIAYRNGYKKCSKEITVSA